jgi:hypothetical protein
MAHGPGREEQLKFAKHFERAQGWLLLAANHYPGLPLGRVWLSVITS